MTKLKLLFYVANSLRDSSELMNLSTDVDDSQGAGPFTKPSCQ
jgi:hypothetical protein